MTGKLAAPQERRAILESRFPVWLPRPAHGALDAAVADFADRPYVVTDERVYSYQDLREWSIRLARGLVRAGVRPGDNVALLFANYPELVAVRFALSRVGATVVPVNFLYRQQELAYALRQSNSVGLITMDSFRGLDYLAMLDEIAVHWEKRGGGDQLPDLRRVFVFETGHGPARKGVDTVADLALDDPSVSLPPDVSPQAISDILYTSGTTGFPKGVMLTHDMILRTAYGSAYARAFEEGRSIAFSLPMYHVAGYVEGMLTVLFIGGSIIPQLVFDPVAMLRCIERHRANDTILVPAMAIDVLKEAERHPYDLSSLTSVMCSGGFKPPAFGQRILDVLGPEEISGGYGMSETVANTTLVHPEDPIERFETHGRLKYSGIAGEPSLGGFMVDYKVVDTETGATLPPGAPGELLARGPGVTPGYYRKPEESAEAFDGDGWFHTGDLGSFDEDGFLTLAGRNKDVYRCGGEQVMPKEIEDLLTTHAAIAAAYVVPLKDERMGEVGVACIVLTEGASARPDELQAFCADRLAKFKVPRHVLFVQPTDIPMTLTGRPRKFLLAEQVQRQLGQQPRPRANGTGA